MAFSTDQQTLNDLGIFGRPGHSSIYSIYNRCTTRGGAAILEEWFRHPLSDATAINQRSAVIRDFAAAGIAFPFKSEAFDVIEHYLANTDERTKLTGREPSVVNRISQLVAQDADTLLIHKGVESLRALLNEMHAFLGTLEKVQAYEPGVNEIKGLLKEPDIEAILQGSKQEKISHPLIASYDVVFRFRCRAVIQKLLRAIYQLDMYLSVATVAISRGFVFPRALPAGGNTTILRGLYHPLVKNAVANDLLITPQSNVVFLTGANMAGKSTFMKSVSIALFLAHAGLPVAASQMEFSVLDGIYTTINLPDNLGMGASHFYAEVLRVKKMAQELRLGKNLFVVFDELFRGTNVKDAYEGTIAIVDAFARRKNSVFIISTHIVEAGEVLERQCQNVQFLYLPTVMENRTPVYTYRLKQGVTDDRHGMVIIRKEGILDILEAGFQKTKAV